MNAQKLIGKALRHLISVASLIGVSALGLAGCGGKQAIRIGFVAQLTGVQAELGVQERNGVQLAVEEINAAGGIAGYLVELIVRDDLGTPEGAQAADRELIDSGVVAIIGHATSAQTIAGLEVTNPAQVVMISPTATSPELSGREDYFFRVAYSLVERAGALAEHVHEVHQITRVAVIYDTDNAAYSRAYQEAFANKYESLGGDLVAEAEFSSKAQPDFAPLVEQLQASSPEGLLIIAADIDTALIAQRTRLMDWPVPLFGTAWAQTDTLINNGGQAVEGLEIEFANAVDDQSPDYVDFQNHYQTRFGEAPSFGATLSYEAAKVLAAALQETGGKPDGLTQALTAIKDFKGLTDTFSFDKYGDVVRPFLLGTVHNGEYVDIAAFHPTEP